MPDTIYAQHPDPSKQGTRIDAEKYHTIREAIEATVRARGEVGFTDLIDAVSEQIGETFAGSVPWYVTTVKLDLEAQGVIERVPKASPQRLRFLDG